MKVLNHSPLNATLSSARTLKITAERTQNLEGNGVQHELFYLEGRCQ